LELKIMDGLTTYLLTTRSGVFEGLRL